MYIPLQRAYSIPSIFRIILYWNQVSFQDHLVLEYSVISGRVSFLYSDSWLYLEVICTRLK